jgi:hypothetical protein
MPRKAIIVLLMLSYSPAMAASSGRSPATDRLAPAAPVALRPGKPAGVKHAQEGTYDAIAIGALAVIAIAGYVASTHSYKLPGTTAPTSTQP